MLVMRQLALPTAAFLVCTSMLPLLFPTSVAAQRSDLEVSGAVHAGGTDFLGDYHSLLLNAGAEPESGEINSVGDLYVQLDVEVGDVLALTSAASEEAVGELEGEDGVPDRLELRTVDRADPASEPEVWITSRSGVRFISDIDGDTNILPFGWFNNGSTDPDDRVAELSGAGNLRIAGTLFENVSFDLATAFLARGVVEAGQVVRLSSDDELPAVVPASAGERAILGVVSDRSGVVLGGSAFSAASLRRVWGDAVADLFEGERQELELAAVARSGVLAARQESLRGLQLAAGASRTHHAEDGAADLASLAETEAARLAAEIESEALRLFFDRRVVAVAVAGRVEVQADTSGGPIGVGDPLQAGSTPGVARRATEPGPVLGIALEDLDPAEGRVTMLVARGWWPGGGGTRLVAAEAASGSGLGSPSAALDYRGRELARLRARLERLEAMLGTGGEHAVSRGRAASSPRGRARGDSAGD